MQDRQRGKTGRSDRLMLSLTPHPVTPRQCKHSSKGMSHRALPNFLRSCSLTT